jgi:RNA polymerase sigma-70 factor (ECF subfamily)
LDLDEGLADLLEATATGDRAAFRRLYDATSSRLFGIALLMLRRRDAAEDVLQEAYLRVWTRAGRYDRQRGVPMPWLARIVRNTAIDRLNQDRATQEDIADHAGTLAADAVPLLENIDMAAQLDGLSPDQRRAVLLAFFHGFTSPEVAARMGVPVGTAKSWIRRGAQHLKVQFAM